MKLRAWVKMGLKIIKYSIMIILVLSCMISSTSDKQLIKTEVFEFNKTFGMTANVVKDEEEIPYDPIAELYSVKGSYSGSLTGYSADCPACGGKLACKSSYNVYKNGVVTYPDPDYGNVRIVASSKNLKCGSIIEFNSSRVSGDTTYAIVLDRGVLGTNIDLLVPSEEYASKNIGRSKISYNVLRYGW